MTPALVPLTELLEDVLGMAAATVGPRAIEAALRRRLDATGLPTAAAYLIRVRADRDELAELVDAVIVPETWFFRYPESFRHLASFAANRRTGFLRPFRVLSAPCCSGEEAYSIAVTLADAGLAPGTFRVDGVDVSHRLVEYAEHGVYGPSAFRETPANGRWFEAKTNSFTVRPEVRQAAGFRVGNLADPKFLAGEAQYDAVFCRNLFIYLTPAAKRTAVANLDRLLAPDGLAFMGHAEPLGLLDGKFKSVGPPQAFAFGRSPTAAEPGPIVIPPVVISPNTGPRESITGPLTKAARQEVPADPWLAAKAAADAGRAADAATLCEQALASQGPRADGFALLGVARLMTGDHRAAEAAFTRALYLDPGHYDALIHMMALADRRGDGTAAANYRRRAAIVRGANG